MKRHRMALAEYKQRQFPMGVLQIRNLANGNFFLDSGLNLPALGNRHRFQLELGAHPQRELQDDWKEFGAGAFEFEAVAELERVESEPDRDYRGDVKALEALYREEKTQGLGREYGHDRR